MGAAFCRVCSVMTREAGGQKVAQIVPATLGTIDHMMGNARPAFTFRQRHAAPEMISFQRREAQGSPLFRLVVRIRTSGALLRAGRSPDDRIVQRWTGRHQKR